MRVTLFTQGGRIISIVLTRERVTLTQRFVPHNLSVLSIEKSYVKDLTITLMN